MNCIRTGEGSNCKGEADPGFMFSQVGAYDVLKSEFTDCSQIWDKFAI